MIPCHWALLPLLLVACHTAGPERDGQVWQDVPNDHARCFRIARNGDQRMLTVLGEGGSSDTVASYLLAATDDFPGAIRLTAPLQRIAVMSTTHLAFLHALQALDRVVAASHREEIRDPGALAQLPTSLPDLSTAAGLDRERLVVLAPDAVFDHPFGKADRSAALLQQVPTLFITEYLEEHPLGRAEWVRFFGALLGLEERADSLYRAIAQRYLAIRDDAAAGVDPPGVIFGSSWQGRWYVPPANSYMGALIRDAGGTYLFGHDGPGNLAIDLETMLYKARSASYFGVVLASDGPVDAMALAGGDGRVAGLKAVQRGGFIGNSNVADLFGKALLEPDVVLRDLQCIFRSGECSGYQPTYFFSVVQ